ncbi:methyltransferase family protein [Aeoliella sp.]|uniref:methyltransferase family protein n=1 Tax=Aeoliella sp. TaxID=2795800 RepID=UPI003CCBF353
MIYSVAFATGVLVIAVNAILVYSIVRPTRRIWPPPAQKTWQYYTVWLLTILSFGGFIVVGILDWNSFDWPSVVRWPIGATLILLGNILAWVGVRQLSMKTTSGGAGPLVTNGLYRYSRNPQYSGDIAIIAGWAILSASWWAFPLCIGGIVAFVITPFAEEPWLEELHGEEYTEYRRKVPRFL